RNPNVEIDVLKNSWVDNTLTVYIGKAGTLKNKASLKTRLKQYLRFGDGKNVGHYGGRYIWQIAESKSLVFCWKPISATEPKKVETILLTDFHKQYKKLPFANLTF
ncbi:MAG: hypothetical protein K8F24_11325, partial [Bacteroidales bacterium]|nr:hypothetical protein [Bacteroidales bacterium]